MQKIIKNITVIILLFFTLSSTGIPIVLHLCNTMGKVSFKSCEMCDDNNTDGYSKLSRVNDCCKNKIVASPLTENYVSSKSEKDEFSISGILFLPPAINYASDHLFLSKFILPENSPPGILQNPLFITKSELLI